MIIFGLLLLAACLAALAYLYWPRSTHQTRQSRSTPETAPDEQYEESRL